MNVQAYKTSFDPTAHSYLREKMRIAGSVADHREIDWLVEYSSRLFFGGGKRLRPYVFELAFRTGGGRPAEATQEIALGIELFHLFCLVHDDIIDESSLRHGVTTAHVSGAEKWGTKTGHDQALLLGDLLFAWSQEYLTGGIMASPVGQAEALAQYFAMVQEVIVGQMLDVQVVSQETASEEELYRKTFLKTSRYTFYGPAALGFALAGKDFSEFLHDFCTPFGLAFQLQDDLLDMIGTVEELQKPIGQDAAQHQHTLLTDYIKREGSAGMQAWTNQKLKTYFDDSRQAIQILPQDFQSEWLELVGAVEHRTS